MKKTLKICVFGLAGMLSTILPKSGFSKAGTIKVYQRATKPGTTFTTGEEEQKNYSLVQKQLFDTVRTVGWQSGPNPRVTIDGKAYPADILTKISPNCIASALCSDYEVTIKTKQHKIESATATDIANAKIIINWENSTYPCFRYYLANEDGSHYAVVRVNLFGWGLEAKVDPRAKVLIIIDGKKYSETDLQDLHTVEPETKPTFKIAETIEDMKRLYPQYAKEYGAVIEFKSVKN